MQFTATTGMIKIIKQNVIIIFFFYVTRNDKKHVNVLLFRTFNSALQQHSIKDFIKNDGNK